MIRYETNSDFSNAAHGAGYVRNPTVHRGNVELKVTEQTGAN